MADSSSQERNVNNEVAPDPAMVAELKRVLLEYGNALLTTGDSTEELLNELDGLEHLLLHLGQACKSVVEESFEPIKKALISNKLLRHAEEDVRIMVASCISEIIRITAPDEPYEEDQMKDAEEKRIDASLENNLIDNLKNDENVNENYGAVLRSCDQTNQQESVSLDAKDKGLAAASHGEVDLFRDGGLSKLVECSNLDILKIDANVNENCGAVSQFGDQINNQESVLDRIHFTLAPDVDCSEANSPSEDDVAKFSVENSNANDVGGINVVQEELKSNDVPLLSKWIRKPHSRIKPEEGYDPLWVWSHSVSIESSHSRKNTKPKAPHLSSSLVVESKQEKLDQIPWKDLLAGDGILKTPVKRKRSSTRVVHRKGLDKALLGNRIDGIQKPLEGSPNKVDRAGKSQCESITSEDISGDILIKNQSKKRRRSISKKASRGTSEEEASKVNPAGKCFGEDLVGHKIKVWWPLDRTYYEGKVTSFNSLNMKHQVDYDDGDVETLDLAHQCWEMIDGNLSSHEQNKVPSSTVRSHDPGCSITSSSRKKLTKEQLGHEPTVAEGFFLAHARTEADGSQRWSDNRSHTRHRWTEMVGGEKKGSVFGLARLAAQRHRSYPPSVREEQLQGEISQLQGELGDMRTRLQSATAELDQMRTRYDSQQLQIDTLTQFMTQMQRVTPSTPFPPSTSHFTYPTTAPRPSVPFPSSRFPHETSSRSGQANNPPTNSPELDNTSDQEA